MGYKRSILRVSWLGEVSTTHSITRGPDVFWFCTVLYICKVQVEYTAVLTQLKPKCLQFDPNQGPAYSYVWFTVQCNVKGKDKAKLKHITAAILPESGLDRRAEGFGLVTPYLTPNGHLMVNSCPLYWSPGGEL